MRNLYICAVGDMDKKLSQWPAAEGQRRPETAYYRRQAVKTRSLNTGFFVW